jgi:hypothetical protein
MTFNWLHYLLSLHKQAINEEWNEQINLITEQIHRELLSLSIGSVMTEEEI